MKITFNISSYIFYIILILSGYINYLIIYLIIIFIHELGHIITIKLLKYNINKIIIYPYGGVIITNININISSNKLFSISISGILFQIILMLLLPISTSYNYNIFINLNINLILFNLLPIYPLDGYKILLSIIERTYKYKIILIISYIISIIFIIILSITTKSIFILVVLIIINYKYIKNHIFIFNKFLLERYLYPNKYKYNKVVKDIYSMYKNRNNIINNKTEKEIVKF
jgi:stage IV sporulation protein FB